MFTKLEERVRDLESILFKTDNASRSRLFNEIYVKIKKVEESRKVEE